MKCLDRTGCSGDESRTGFARSWCVFKSPCRSTESVRAVPNQGLTRDHEQLRVAAPFNPNNVRGCDFVQLSVAKTQRAAPIRKPVQLADAEETKSSKVDDMGGVANDLGGRIACEERERLTRNNPGLKQKVARRRPRGYTRKEQRAGGRPALRTLRQ